MMAAKAEKLAKKIFGEELISSKGNRTGKFFKKYKVVVFVPPEKTDEMTFALSAAGAGNIGNYSVCSFRLKGTGTFMGSESSNPAIGKKGKFETAEEVRLEMICGKKNIDSVAEAIFKHHPYDEPAFEIYEVLTREKPRADVYRFGLRKNISAKLLLKKLNRKIDYKNIITDLKNIRIDSCIIDLTGAVPPDPIPEGTVFIAKNKKIIKAYL